MPQRDAGGAFVFPGAPTFRPNRSPEEVIRSGAFGGGYFRPIHSAVTKQDYRDQHLEFPPAWFAGLNIGKRVTSPVYDAKVGGWPLQWMTPVTGMAESEHG